MCGIYSTFGITCHYVLVFAIHFGGAVKKREEEYILIRNRDRSRSQVPWANATYEPRPLPPALPHHKHQARERMKDTQLLAERQTRSQRPWGISKLFCGKWIKLLTVVRPGARALWAGLGRSGVVLCGALALSYDLGRSGAFCRALGRSGASWGALGSPGSFWGALCRSGLFWRSGELTSVHQSNPALVCHHFC